jgi:hypothetical protein
MAAQIARAPRPVQGKALTGIFLTFCLSFQIQIVQGCFRDYALNGSLIW